jgi:hypothetical protein
MLLYLMHKYPKLLDIYIENSHSGRNNDFTAAVVPKFLLYIHNIPDHGFEKLCVGSLSISDVLEEYRKHTKCDSLTIEFNDIARSTMHKVTAVTI